jgi:hypothetical protein
MPYCVSKIHCQITVLVSAGIDHASISPTIVSSRIFDPSRVSSSAIAIPMTIVSATFTAQNNSVLRSTAQNSASWRMVRKFWSPTQSAAAPNCCLRPNFCNARVTRRTIG